MCQVTVKYSENLPSTEPNSFKTRHFAVELTEKVDDNDNAVEVTAQLFRVAKAQVKSQIQSETADLAMNQPTQSQYKPYQAPTQQVPFQPPQQQSFPSPSSGYNPNTPKPASDKQLNLLNMLAKKSGMSSQELMAMPQQFFGKPSLQSLTSQEASRIIDSLNQRKAA